MSSNGEELETITAQKRHNTGVRYDRISLEVVYMRTRGIEIISAILLGIVIPSLLVAMLQDRVRNDQIPITDPATENETSADNGTIAVLQDNNTIEMIPIEQYVLSVVLSEMPADFEPEALKAQAVVARTYALRRTNGKEKHGSAAVCTKSSCCQGFCPTESYLMKGGNESSVRKVREAVLATEGLVLVFNGKLIDATYFSCSGGVTEDAEAVWGTEIPYLQSVESPGEERATHYVDTVRYSVKDFIDRVQLKDDGKRKVKIGEIIRTVGGGVESLEINGVRFTGTQLRKQLKLRSTAFYISVLGDTVTITTKGFGHRVGMSQYGADAMALNGASFKEILAHYYQGTELIPVNID